MSLNKFKISDDLIQNQQFQKKNLTQQIEENTKLQKLHEHFEESCHSEIFSTCRQININNIVTQNNDRSMNYSSIQEDQTPRQNIKNSQTGQLISNSVITNESLIQNKEQSQVKQKSNLSRSQVVNDDRQMTFNEDAQRQSVRSSMRGSYIQKPKQKNEGKVDFSSKTTQFKKDLLKLTHIRKKMMKFFYQNTIFGRTNFLNENHIQPIINDLSDINDKIKISSQRQICIELFSFLEESKFNFLKHIPPFNPQNIIIFFLNTLFCVCNCLFYIVLSIDMIYDAQIPDLIIYTILIVQTIEISVRLNTSVYIQTDYFTDRKIIFMKYLKNECFYDVLPYFFLIMQFSFSDEYNLVLKISSFIKIHNLAKEYKTIHEQISLSTQKYYYYVQLVHLVLSIFLIGHLIACMYYSIGLVEQNVLTIETWFSQGFNADHFIWWRLYLESIYWSLTLMTTGSNVVYTPLQAFFTSFIMLFSTIIFAYFINTIGDILSQKDEEEINQRIDINIINQYMRKRNINKYFFNIHLLLFFDLIFLSRMLIRQINIKLYETNNTKIKPSQKLNYTVNAHQLRPN